MKLRYCISKAIVFSSLTLTEHGCRNMDLIHDILIKTDKSLFPALFYLAGIVQADAEGCMVMMFGPLPSAHCPEEGGLQPVSFES